MNEINPIEQAFFDARSALNQIAYLTQKREHLKVIAIMQSKLEEMEKEVKK